MPPTRRSTTSAAPPSGDRRWLILAALIGLVGLAALAWALWPREDKLADLTALQRQFLASGGAPSSAEIRRVIATADRMSREELRSAYRAAFEQWRGIREQAIEAALAASGPERQRLLDEYLDRMHAFGELVQAMNPRAGPDGGGFFPGRRWEPSRSQGRDGDGRRQPGAPPADSPEARAERARREMAARFDEFVAARAKERGIELPRPRR